jgi:hypothetical protein
MHDRHRAILVCFLIGGIGWNASQSQARFKPNDSFICYDIPTQYFGKNDSLWGQDCHYFPIGCECWQVYAWTQASLDDYKLYTYIEGDDLCDGKTWTTEMAAAQYVSNTNYDQTSIAQGGFLETCTTDHVYRTVSDHARQKLSGGSWQGLWDYKINFD